MFENRTITAAALAATLALLGAGCQGPQPQDHAGGPPPEKQPENAGAPESTGGPQAPAGKTAVTIKADWQQKDGAKVAAISWSLDEAQPNTVMLEGADIPPALVEGLTKEREALATRGGHPQVIVEGTRDNELFEKGLTVAIRAAVRAGFPSAEIQYQAPVPAPATAPAPMPDPIK